MKTISCSLGTTLFLTAAVMACSGGSGPRGGSAQGDVKSSSEHNSKDDTDTKESNEGSNESGHKPAATGTSLDAGVDGGTSSTTGPMDGMDPHFEACMTPCLAGDSRALQIMQADCSTQCNDNACRDKCSQSYFGACQSAPDSCGHYVRCSDQCLTR